MEIDDILYVPPGMLTVDFVDEKDLCYISCGLLFRTALTRLKRVCVECQTAGLDVGMLQLARDVLQRACGVE